MRGCAPALTVHIKFFHRPGLPRAAWCVSMSKSTVKPRSRSLTMQKYNAILSLTIVVMPIRKAFGKVTIQFGKIFGKMAKFQSSSG